MSTGCDNDAAGGGAGIGTGTNDCCEVASLSSSDWMIFISGSASLVGVSGGVGFRSLFGINRVNGLEDLLEY